MFDATASAVYEAKSSAERRHVRLAVGQLMDYRRYLGEDVAPSALLPSRPLGDLEGLLEFANIGLSCPEGSRFRLPFA